MLPVAISEGEVPLPAELHRIGLDLSVVHAVQLLFPKGRGLLLLALLCRYAVVKQLVLPDIGQVDVAVIAFASVEVFARQHGWGKDTALRYLTIFSALGILTRHRTKGQSVLYLPLTSWSPSPARLAALETLLIEQTARPKLQQLAKSVKERFHLLYGSASRSLFEDVSQTLTDIQEILNKRLCASKRRLLHLRIEDLKGRLATQTGDVCVRAECVRLLHLSEQGDSSVERKQSFAAKGDFERRTEKRQGHGFAQEGDLRRLPAIADVASLAQEGDLQAEGRKQRTLCLAGKGDLADVREEGPANHLTEQGDLEKQLPAHGGRKGDQRTREKKIGAEKGDFASTLHVRDRSFLEKEDSTNVQRESWEELAVCVEGHTGNRYQYEQYLASADPRLVLATYLYVQEEVWSRQHTPQPVKAPGAYFRTVIRAWRTFSSYDAACQAYADAYEQFQAKGKTPSPRDRLPGIPVWVQELVEQVQGWRYTDVKNELAVQFHRRKAGTSAVFSPSQESLFGQEEVLEPEVPSCWMTTEAEAEALIERMVQEAPTIGSHAEQLRVRPYRVRGSGMTVFVVDALIERTPQVYAAPEQWEAYFLPYLRDLEEGRWSLPPQR